MGTGGVFETHRSGCTLYPRGETMKFLMNSIILVVAFPGAAAQDPATKEAKKTSTTKTTPTRTTPTKTTPRKTTPANCGLPQICSQERWTVKTLTDAHGVAVVVTPVAKQASD